MPFSDCHACRHVVSFPDIEGDARTVVCQLESPKGADLAERTVLAERTFACVEGDTPFASLQALFVDEAVTGVPVVDEAGRPVGMLERSDFLRGCANERHPQEMLPGMDADGLKLHAELYGPNNQGNRPA